MELQKEVGVKIYQEEADLILDFLNNLIDIIIQE